MKHLKQSVLLLSLIILLASSCKKEIVENNFRCPKSTCLLTHYEDDFLGSFDIFYNQRGNPDSLNVNGFGYKLAYDNRGRLVKQKFATGYIEFIYKNNSFLPAIRRVWRLDIITPAPAGLIEVDSLQYNMSGQLIRKGITNRIAPDFNLFQKYEYNNLGNVTRVTIGSQNGGSYFAAPVLAFAAIKYDNKLNIFVSNQWLKYLFDNTEFSDYSYLMNSINNAAGWKWGYGGSYVATVTSSIIYNKQGFANSFASHLTDTDGGEIDFARLSSSTCDAAPAPMAALRPSNKASNFQFHKTNRFGVPLIAQHP